MATTPLVDSRPGGAGVTTSNPGGAGVSPENPDEILHALLTTSVGQADPYPLYRELRRRAPVHRSDLDGVWYVSGYEAAKQMLFDPRCGKGPDLIGRRHGISEDRAESARRRRRYSMLTTNPPEHTRLRRVARAPFTPPAIDRLEARVAGLVEQRLSALAEQGPDVEVMGDLARRLPLAVIAELVGVPPEDRDRFEPVVRAIMANDQPNPPPEAVARAERAGDDFEAYFVGLAAERRAHPGNDLLSHLVAVASNGGLLSEEEIFGTISLVFIAGFLTTTNLIGNGLLALFRHPAELAQLWSDPSLATGSVEEMLRYDTPSQLIHRKVLSDLELAGHQLRAGEMAMVMLGAVNRDEGVFPEPDRFLGGRDPNPHLAFAWGVHFCLGAALARLEGRLVFEGLVRRFHVPELLAAEPARRPGLTLRGLEELPVRLPAR